MHYSRKVPVLIDGAHALGALPLHLCDLQPDYYISNAHKWFCSPKGSAFMFVKKELQAQTRPLIISHGFGSGFNSEFVWAGNIIQENQLTLRVAPSKRKIESVLYIDQRFDLMHICLLSNIHWSYDNMLILKRKDIPVHGAAGRIFESTHVNPRSQASKLVATFLS